MRVNDEPLVACSSGPIQDQTYRIISYLYPLILHLRVRLDQEGQVVGQAQRLHLRHEVDAEERATRAVDQVQDHVQEECREGLGVVSDPLAVESSAGAGEEGEEGRQEDEGGAAVEEDSCDP